MRRLLAAVVGSSFALITFPAIAQNAKKDEPTKDIRGNPLGRLVMLHDLESGRQSQIARTKQKAGDCKGALDAFDAALRGSNDPTLRRDRGLCHESLGHVVPAIEDYRAYLTALPEANDANGIRERLDRLRGEVPPDPEPQKETNTASGAYARGGFSMRAGSDGVSSSATASTAGGTKARDESDEIGTSKELSGHDAALALERKESELAKDAESNGSALRRGRGPVLGVAAGPRWFSGESATDGGYIVAATFRYSFGPTLSFLGDLGYTSRDRGGTASTEGGLAALAGLELRVPLNPRVSDAIVFGGGLGYERLKRDSQGLVTSIFMPRFRAGYRHVFGPSFGLEATVDVGYGFASVQDLSRTYGVLAIGPNLALVTAF